MRLLCVCLAVGLTVPAAASAQMAVSTFGATDAQLCYQAAVDQFASDTEDCDQALKDGAMTMRDRMATYVNRGIILNRAGRLDEALDDFDKALDRDDGLAEAYLNRGNTYFLMRQYDDAISDYEAALRYDLKKADIAWYNIGLAHEAKRDDVKAKEAYRTALEINPDFGPALRKIGADAPAQE